MTRIPIKSGHYYRQRTPGAQPEEVTAGPPDAVICRRVVDYPNARPPSAARLASCAGCGAIVAFDPAGPHLDRPRVCFQCAKMTPLPYGD